VVVVRGGQGGGGGVHTDEADCKGKNEEGEGFGYPIGCP